MDDDQRNDAGDTTRCSGPGAPKTLLQQSAQSPRDHGESLHHSSSQLFSAMLVANAVVDLLFRIWAKVMNALLGGPLQ
jgi:hypothetical protein